MGQCIEHLTVDGGLLTGLSVAFLPVFVDGGESEDEFFRGVPTPPAVAATAPLAANANLSADQTTTLLTATNITGLSFSVLSGEVWSFEVFIRNNKSSLTAGIKYAINAPAASTLEAQIQGTTSATTAVQHERMSGLTTLTTAAFNTVANADGFVRIAGVVVAGANGTVQIQHAAVTSQTATARANSYITARKIA
jgi:hypothetical protein